MSTPRICSARRADGKPCRAWAKRDSDPPLCVAHAATGAAARAGRHRRPEASPDETRPSEPGFYTRSYSLEEVADLVSLALDDSLDDEVAAARVAVRRVMQQLEEELTPAEYARLASIVFTGTNTIARLMQARRNLSSDADEAFARAITQAVGEMAKEKGWDIEL